MQVTRESHEAKARVAKRPKVEETGEQLPLVDVPPALGELEFRFAT